MLANKYSAIISTNYAKIEKKKWEKTLVNWNKQLMVKLIIKSNNCP